MLRRQVIRNSRLLFTRKFKDVQSSSTAEQKAKHTVHESEEQPTHGGGSGVGLTEEAEEKRFAIQRDKELFLKMARENDKKKHDAHHHETPAKKQ